MSFDGTIVTNGTMLGLRKGGDRNDGMGMEDLMREGRRVFGSPKCSKASRLVTSAQEHRGHRFTCEASYEIEDLCYSAEWFATRVNPVLALLLKKRSERAAVLQATATPSQTGVHSLDRVPSQHSSFQPAYRSTAPKRRPKPVQIARLYPEAPPAPLRQARALLDLIHEECPDFVGRYIPRSDLERTYRELCAAQSWETHHWTAIGRQLRCLTKKRELKRAGIRFVAYHIPRPSSASVPHAQYAEQCKS